MIGSLLVVLLSAGLGVAEPSVHQAAAVPDARPNRAPGELSPAEVVGMLDAYALVQAQNALQLNDSQYGAFVGRLKALQETRRKNQRARNQVVQELRRLTGQQATTLDEAAVRDRLRALRELDERSAADLRRAYDALDEVLDIRQQARFRIFEENLERRKMDLLLRARQRAAGRRDSGQ
ncbi:MAG TPA: hypothetical protein VL882_26515 [Vicinamibacterales bacterium]|jgi:hypothetical protein|nr:hypothetical protein [Vicinamibacterales bacterium]